jgi:hypothetical protein
MSQERSAVLDNETVKAKTRLLATHKQLEELQLELAAHEREVRKLTLRKEGQQGKLEQLSAHAKKYELLADADFEKLELDLRRRQQARAERTQQAVNKKRHEAMTQKTRKQQLLTLEEQVLHEQAVVAECDAKVADLRGRSKPTSATEETREDVLEWERRAIEADQRYARLQRENTELRLRLQQPTRSLAGIKGVSPYSVYAADRPTAPSRPGESAVAGKFRFARKRK